MATGRAKASPLKARSSHQVAILVADGLNLLDVAGPAQVFATASDQLERAGMRHTPSYAISVLGSRGGKIETSSGVQILIEALQDYEPSQFDTILIAGGAGAEMPRQDSGLIEWLKSAARTSARIGGICTGAYLLAEAGLLRHRRATSHWAYCSDLQSKYADVTIEPDAIFVEDGVWTSAGITAGIDMVLAMVEADWGREIALRTAQWLVVFLKRPGGQSQFSTSLRVQHCTDRATNTIIEWIVHNPQADLRLATLAEQFGITERTLHRAFLKGLGQSPAEFVEDVRFELARRLLQDTELQVGIIAQQSGFFHVERMRRVFIRRIGVGPSAYRERFSWPRLRPGAESMVSLQASRQGVLSSANMVEPGINDG